MCVCTENISLFIERFGMNTGKEKLEKRQRKMSVLGAGSHTSHTEPCPWPGVVLGCRWPPSATATAQEDPWKEKGSRGCSVSAEEKTFHRFDCDFSLDNLVPLQADRTLVTTCLGLPCTEWSVFRRVIKCLLATKRVTHL